MSARAYRILSLPTAAFWVDADPTIFAYEATLSVADAIRRAGSDEPAAIQRAFKTTTMQSLLGGGHALDVTAGSETINGSGQRSEACTDRSPIELTRSVRARFGGNPHPAARSENDWKVAAFEY